MARAAERIKRLRDSGKDTGVTFEQTGFDYVIVDEAHGYKYLEAESNSKLSLDSPRAGQGPSGGDS